MFNEHDIQKKVQEAARILSGSLGPSGIYAGSGERYKHQYWTRDAALALIHAFNSLARVAKEFGIDFKLPQSTIYAHLRNLVNRQSQNGAIPILYSDFDKLLLHKIANCSWNNGILDASGSFVLQRIFDGILGNQEAFSEFADFEGNRERGLYRLTPGTTDSELMFAFAMLNFGKKRSEENQQAIQKAIAYLEMNYVYNGLHHGADWRDTMEKFLRDKPLLSNNAILYEVYKANGDIIKAEKLKRAIDDTFWNGETYIDYPGSDRFDPLGASLAVLHGLVPKERYAAVIKGYRSVDSNFGVTIQCKHKPYQAGEAEMIERTDGIVVWPFVVGFTVLASAKIGDIIAIEQFAKLHNLDGFAEWYDPLDGCKWGEPQQAWSAALYIRSLETIMMIIN